MAQLFAKMQFYGNRTTSRRHHLQKIQKKCNLKSKKSALCIKCLENLKYKKMAQMFQKMQFYEHGNTSRKKNSKKNTT